ncbi:uncharacterized protein LOC106654701 isoform X2 [Trichogramma pretiosum]|uniref:uncharacterized protein LOC106654701 isoform X2 n=1 Tax=Trichogramma pretiosum TaxID=7493 RepID=UPI000C718E46|nr:uncharacterized protein LOC106654701 isoform X2 [Trichogramma pretiosum]
MGRLHRSRGAGGPRGRSSSFIRKNGHSHIRALPHDFVLGMGEFRFYRIMYGERHDGMQFDHQIADNRLLLEANGTTYNVGYRIQFAFYPWWRQSYEQNFPTLFTLPSIKYYKTVFNLYKSFKYLLNLAAQCNESDRLSTIVDYQVLMHLNFTVHKSISAFIA